jgi:hypothetical protein
VRASGSATVRAYGSATVRASGSATVEAYDSATVQASDSATVRAYDSATVEAYGSATVQASKYVGIHRYGTTPNITGGVLIQIPGFSDNSEWLEFYGVKITRGYATLFKGVDDAYKSGYGTDYTPGAKPTCPDWAAGAFCGNGLHFSPRAFMTRKYASDATRFVACKVKVADLVVIGQSYGPPDKCKAPACTVLFECDEDGVQVESARVAT